MHINYDKTDYVILGRTNKQSVSQKFDIIIDGKHIKKTQNNKLLVLAYILMINFLGLPT